MKLSIGLSGALAGFLLAQIGTTIRAYFQRAKTLKLLIEELKDIDRESTRLLYFHGRNLQLYGAQGFVESAAIGVSNPIFSNYYKDVLLHLNQSQRISFQMIHGLVGTQNFMLNQIENLCSVMRKEHRTNGLSAEFLRCTEELGELTKHGYSNCAIIKWHIDFHLNNQDAPNLSPGTEDHRAYLQYLESVIKEMNQTIESGKTISKEKFETIYNPNDFEAQL
ncbi:MAG TPA: hypothetical protein VGU03_02355 [Frateuria sp.]|uniref:hypothetical protein n=1 Tax=Frateuria sp. TaxID=2211372 RepID=UPI002DEC04C0|nr:hypothetical protein [Frateuria sp.]